MLTGTEMKGTYLLLVVDYLFSMLFILERNKSIRLDIVLCSTLKQENGNEEL